jgi:hypothetical protein
MSCFDDRVVTGRMNRGELKQKVCNRSQKGGFFRGGKGIHIEPGWRSLKESAEDS